MTEKVTHRETSIVLVHEIDVDSCIADEIEKLNNIDNIFTLSSCCGHGKAGYIIVAGGEIEKMTGLGYETTALKYLDNDIESGKDRIVLCAFKPKSECACQDSKEEDETQ